MCPNVCIADHASWPGAVRRREATPSSRSRRATSSSTPSSRLACVSPGLSAARVVTSELLVWIAPVCPSLPARTRSSYPCGGTFCHLINLPLALVSIRPQGVGLTDRRDPGGLAAERRAQADDKE